MDNSALPLTRRTGRRPVTWRTMLGLVLVPLTVAGVLLWGLWNPQDRLGSITAAVVNLDEPVELDGQAVPLGRVLAGELIGGDAETNFEWVLTDETDAGEGLDEGRYATVVTIPENFSEAATSLSGDPEDAETATIDIDSSDRGRLLDAALSNIVTQTATSVLNRQLGEQFIGQVFVGMTELHGGIGDAADGASQLAAGGEQLADGGGQLADGAQELADGAGQLVGGTAQLSSGAAELSGGASQLAGGVSGLAVGTGELASGMQDYAAGASDLAGGVEAYVGGVNDVVTQLQGGIGEAVGPIVQLRDAIEQGALPPPPGQSVEETVAGLNVLINELSAAASDDPGSPLTQFKAQGAALAQGARDSAAGAAGLASATQQLASGAAELSGGATQLSSGAAELAEGTGQLAAQTPDLAAGAGQLADGAREAAEGTSQLAGGIGDLADGLDEAEAGIPNYSESQRDRLAETAAQPVEASGANDELFNASGVPLFVGIALWAGALAAFLTLAPLWRRTETAARTIGTIALRSTAPAVLLGALQGTIAGIVLPLTLGYDLAQGARFFGLSLLAGVSFALLVQGLTALFGGFGRFIAFGLLVVSFAVGIVSTVPGPLQAVSDASPIGATFAGFQAIAVDAAGAGSAAVLLALWGVGGAILTAFAVARVRARA